ncbi:MAG: hypothetical protein QOF81_3138 [Acidimicrobiaceae bacterium]|nr:hypothetical protein [Acidimicrobiaceae bacterium]
MIPAVGHLMTKSDGHLSPSTTGMTRGGLRRLCILIAVTSVTVVLGAGMGMVRAGAAPAGDAGPVSADGGSSATAAQLTVTASGATSVGLQVFANVNFSGATNPTGSLTFRLFGPSDPSCVSAPVFTSTVAVAGTSVNSDRYSTTIAGTYRWEATYSGDAGNGAAGPTPCATSTAAVIVGKAMTNVAVTAAAPSAGTIRASAAVTGYSPTGTTTFYLTPPGDTFCSGTPVFTSTISVNGTGSYWSAPYTPTVGGQYKWRATYTGDFNNQLSPMSACLDSNAAVTVTAPATLATLISPADRQAGVDTTTPFTWGPVGSAQGYRVAIGTNPLGSDLADSGVLSASQLSYLVPPLPTGKTLNATLYTEVSGSWAGYHSTTFTAAAGRATLTYPLDGQANVDASVPFRWQTIPQAQAYLLSIGTTYGGSDLLWSGALPASQSSYQVAALPAGALSVVLYTEVNGSWYGYQVIGITAIPTEAALISPTSGQTNVDPTGAFSWTGVSGAQGYALWIGTSYGGIDVFNSGVVPASQHSVTPTALPAGRTLYATMYTMRNGAWTCQVVTFTTGA